ncbi:unnamed protein product [Linum tenue]|uniref:RNase H type-1 domain-containing protein n=1 Tax=Linum tenue TaxID=586396 RepID=A0AAV0IN87_9ROSI|nr:unnamed protein product [Linum tenue]
MALQHDLHDVVLETDCKVLVHKLQHPSMEQNEVGVLCRSIRRLLSDIGNGRWRHICREANEAAHIMAHAESRWNESLVWFDRPPNYLVNQLQLDSVTASTD